MTLSDRTIKEEIKKGNIIIDPFSPNDVHPASVDLHLTNKIVARIEGKSSLGRLGLLIHSTAGFVDPGWNGNLTLELANVSRLPITLYFGMRIGQISFSFLTTEVDKAYGNKDLKSRYQNQNSPLASRAHIDFGSQIKRK